MTSNINFYINGEFYAKILNTTWEPKLGKIKINGLNLYAYEIIPEIKISDINYKNSTCIYHVYTTQQEGRG